MSTPLSASQDRGAAERTALLSPIAAWYAVIVLLIVYTLSTIDTVGLTSIAPTVEVRPDPAQIGVQTSLVILAYVLLYVILAIPFGLLADRVKQRNLIVLGALAGTLVASLLSVTHTFIMLESAGEWVGLAAHVLMPAAFCVIGGLIPREQLSLAMSVFAMEGDLGQLAAESITSVLGAPPAWLIPVLIAVPNILALAMLLAVREPVQPAVAAAARDSRTDGSAAVEMRRCWPSILGLALMMGAQALSSLVISGMVPHLFRLLNAPFLSADSFPTVILTTLCACAGMCCGGLLSDSWLRSGVAEAPLRVGLAGLLGVLLTVVPAALSPSVLSAFALMLPAAFFMALPIGSSYAAIQMIVPAAVRGTVSAAILLFVSLFAIVGQTLLRILLPVVTNENARALGVALAIIIAGTCAAGSLACVLTIRPYRRDFEAMARSESASTIPQTA